MWNHSPAPSAAGSTVSVMLPRASAQACGGSTMGAADFTPYIPERDHIYKLIDIAHTYMHKYINLMS